MFIPILAEARRVADSLRTPIRLTAAHVELLPQAPRWIASPAMSYYRFFSARNTVWCSL